MQAMGIEITEGVFIGISDFITALDNPLPNQRRKKKNKAYSFGSEMDLKKELGDDKEALSLEGTETQLNNDQMYSSPTSKSDILTNSE